MAASVPTSHLLHNFLRPPPPPSPPSLLLYSFIRPLCTTASTSAATFTTILSKCLLHTPLRNNTLFASPSPLPTRPFLFHHSRNSVSHTLPSVNSLSSQEEEDIDEIGEYSEDGDGDNEYDDEDDDDDEEEEGIELESENGELGETVGKISEMGTAVDPSVLQKISMTVKEKKELASYAHSLGDKLKSQLVGKRGVTPNLATSFIETLESNELLKIKIHKSCPGELEDAVKQLEELTGSVVVSQIGRTIIVYRPSLTKLKAEEKKRQNRRLYVRKESRSRPTFMKEGHVERLTRRGRRGSSRFS